MSKLAAVVVTAALLLVPVTADAHTNEQLDAWTIGWGQRVIASNVNIRPLLDAEYEDWANRHPRYFGRPVPHTHTATQTAPRAPQPPVVRSSVEQWRPLVQTHFRAADVDRALRIMACESGGNPNAKSPISSASGLMQHLGKYWLARSRAAGYAGASIFDPTANVAVAAWLRDQQGGWNHWRACL